MKNPKVGMSVRSTKEYEDNAWLPRNARIGDKPSTGHWFQGIISVVRDIGKDGFFCGITITDSHCGDERPYLGLNSRWLEEA